MNPPGPRPRRGGGGGGVGGGGGRSRRSRRSRNRTGRRKKDRQTRGTIALMVCKNGATVPTENLRWILITTHRMVISTIRMLITMTLTEIAGKVSRSLHGQGGEGS
jgi:hypothetical protein